MTALFDQLNTYSTDDLAELNGEEVWTGKLDVGRVL